MISFSFAPATPEVYDWLCLLSVLRKEDPDYVLRTPRHDVQALADLLGSRYGFVIEGGEERYNGTTLRFDDPQKEMLFRLKYL